MYHVSAAVMNALYNFFQAYFHFIKDKALHSYLRRYHSDNLEQCSKVRRNVCVSLQHRLDWTQPWATWSDQTCFEQGIGLDDFQGPFQPGLFHDSVICRMNRIGNCSEIEDDPCIAKTGNASDMSAII